MAWIEFNPNPNGIRVGDCSVRAICRAIGDKWERAFARIALEGFIMGDMPSSDAVWGNVLRRNGFERRTIPNTCPDCYTAEDFCRDNPSGTFVLAFGGHVATVVDGDLYDSWDSRGEIPIYYYAEV